MKHRRRRAVALLAAAAVLVAAGLAIVRLAGGGEPPDTLARLVPANALVYVHASTDPGRGADRRFAARALRLPSVRELRDAALRRVGGTSPGFSFARDIRPWLGDEAAFALLPSGRAGRADSLIAAAVRDRDLARLFIARTGARRTATYRGATILRLGDTSAAVSGDVLLIGQEPGLRAAIDRQGEGGGPALADLPAFERVIGERGVVDLYASRLGASGILAPLAGTFGELLREPALTALGASLTPEPDGIRARARFARSRPAGRGFAPRLARAAPRGAAGLLALDRLDPLLGRLLEAAPGLREVATEAGVDLERDLLAPLRGGEVAVWATAGALVPGVALAARTSDPARTREALGRLQLPLAAALSPGEAEAGQVPLFEQREVGGVPGFALAVAPGLTLTYAVFGSTVVVATSEDAIARVRRADAGLLDAAEDAGRLTVPSAGVNSIVLSDPRQLLALGDQIGVTADPALQAVREDLQLLRTVSAVSQRLETDTTAEMFLELP